MTKADDELSTRTLTYTDDTIEVTISEWVDFVHSFSQPITFFINHLACIDTFILDYKQL